ncbi:hypothetical protein DERP_004760 [Dermatophagoides pteronyssinus]|uniref:Uncharacterized protein n=1 Tax=Dermatophagoides pteronyssinus TaxID=6956 RepID=A0ABQ8JQ68_DERPT|nr:hypothetical protein DERP_004760 [Dermatophagoides pteronyssinus]
MIPENGRQLDEMVVICCNKAACSEALTFPLLADSSGLLAELVVASEPKTFSMVGSTGSSNTLISKNGSIIPFLIAF